MRLIRFVLKIITYPLSFLNFWFLKKHSKNIFFRTAYFSKNQRLCCMVGYESKFETKPITPHGMMGVIVNPNVVVGKNVWIFQFVQIVANTFENSRKYGSPKIGDNVYLGAACIIVGNINIGNNVVVGAGSVVTSSVPDNCMVAGNPAKIIKTLKNGEWVKYEQK